MSNLAKVASVLAWLLLVIIFRRVFNAPEKKSSGGDATIRGSDDKA